MQSKCLVAGLAGCLFAVAVGGTVHRAMTEKEAARPVLECTVTIDGWETPWLPVATEVAQMEKGMSGPTPGPGMLFNWTTSEQRMFWMKNTVVPLSIAFIDSAGVIVEIQEMEAESEQIHTSSTPAREALEIRAGVFEDHGIGVGSRITGRECRGITSAQ